MWPTLRKLIFIQIIQIKRCVAAVCLLFHRKKRFLDIFRVARLSHECWQIELRIWARRSPLFMMAFNSPCIPITYDWNKAAVKWWPFEIEYNISWNKFQLDWKMSRTEFDQRKQLKSNKWTELCQELHPRMSCQCFLTFSGWEIESLIWWHGQTSQRKQESDGAIVRVRAMRATWPAHTPFCVPLNTAQLS